MRYAVFASDWLPVRELPERRAKSTMASRATESLRVDGSTQKPEGALPMPASGGAIPTPAAGGVVPEPGTVVGDIYRVIAPLGSGSMGQVLLAEDTLLSRQVAIKLVHPWLLDDRFRERFTEEARAMARVSDPRVLQIYAFGEHKGAPYFVMEFVAGRTLEHWLAENDMPQDLELALQILEQICQGVSAIHAAETVHRDLKPSNILLDAQFRPHIADLGLAVLCQKEPSGGAEVAGTPAYMAPEIAFPNNPPDPTLRSRADVYSLACVAYELLTGRPPFQARTNFGILMQHATTPAPPPSSLRVGLPPGLDQAILRALAKDPVERTPTAEAFRRDLEAARRGASEPVRILVAEDNEDFRSLLELVLLSEFPDADIECVGDGLAALAAFDRKRPSVVIIDLAMPGLDGMELTGLIRARASSATVPIIVLTASGGASEWKRLAAMGADRFLLKPVVLDDVLALVRRSLHERSSGARQTPSVRPDAEAFELQHSPDGILPQFVER
jgi:eukaryotic-like serine/threonine-protein kinase